jgi:hypothetical protein
MLHRYRVMEGSTELISCDDKAAALRLAAKKAHVRKSVTKVYHVNGQFIKSFDGRCSSLAQ